MVTSLTHSGKEISMISLLVLLVLKEERMKRKRIKGAATNLLLAHTITKKLHASTFHGKKKKFKRKWKGKPRGNFKTKRACYKCGKTGYFKVNCPKNNGGKEQKEIVMTIIEVLMAELTTNTWWIDLAATRHITKKPRIFCQF